MPPCASLCAPVIRATRTPNGGDVRSIGRRSEAQGVNVLRRETKVRKLFIIERPEPRPDALLPGIVVSLNESTHQARSGFQMLGRARGHASPQKLKVHDRLLFSCKERLRVRTGAGGPDVVGLWRPLPVWARVVPAPARSGVSPWRKTPYVVQGARARLTDLALQLSILRRIPSRWTATGLGSCALCRNVASGFRPAW
jgi:hypothetical protein